VAAKADYQRAVLLAGAGDDRGAIASLQRALQGSGDGSDSEAARRLLAALLERSGDIAGSLAQWDSLATGFPRSASMPEYLFRRGRSLLAIGRSTAALDDFQRVVKEFPRSAWRSESSYAIGYMYSQRGEYPRALPFFQSVAQDPSAGEVAERSRLSVGLCFFNMGSYDKALAAFQELREAKPASIADGTIALSIGRTLYRMDRLEDAAQRLSEAANLLAASASPEGAEAFYWLAWARLRLGGIVEARDAFLSVAQRYPEDPRRVESLFRAGICETLRYDDEAAIGQFGKVLDVNSSSSADLREQALYEEGLAFARLGREQASRDAFESLARAFPGGRLAPQAFFKAAERALEAGRFEDAKAGFERVAKDFPASQLAVQARYWAAETAWRSGDPRGALDGYWACLAAHPDAGLEAAALDGLRTALRSVGSLELARQVVDKAKSARGLSVAAAAGIQLAYADMLLPGRPADALAAISDVKRSSPPEPQAGETSLLLGRYYAAVADPNRAMDIFGALRDSRADEIGALATMELARTLEAAGRTSEAIDEYLKVSYLFSDFPDLAAEGLWSALIVARNRGDRDRASKIEQSLRTGYPGSPWALKLGNK
jgi:TolA-binding protein